jgi:RimJ/RimL family protein N-acetyltransferase
MHQDVVLNEVHFINRGCKMITIFKNFINKFTRKIISIYQILKYSSKVVIQYEHKINKDFKTEAVICPVSYENIGDVSIYGVDRHNINKYKKMLQQGDLGYYAYLDNKWVHRTWVMVGPKTIERWYHFPPQKLRAGEAYCHFGETLPSVRGCGITPAVLSRIISDLKNKVNHIYVIVDKNNYPSRKTVEKAGFIEIKRKKVMKIFGFHYYKDLKISR